MFNLFGSYFERKKGEKEKEEQPENNIELIPGNGQKATDFYESIRDNLGDYLGLDDIDEIDPEMFRDLGTKFILLWGSVPTTAEEGVPLEVPVLGVRKKYTLEKGHHYEKHIYYRNVEDIGSLGPEFVSFKFKK